MADKPRIPEVGEFVRGLGKLVAIQEFPPVAPPSDYIFEETECRIESYANGKFIQAFGTFHEHFGEGTAFSNAMADCKKLQKQYGPGIEFRIVKKTWQTRERTTHVPNYYQNDVMNFAKLEYGSGRDLPQDREEVVWSSAKKPKSAKKASR